MATSSRRKVGVCGSEEIGRECIVLALFFLAVTTVVADSPNLQRKITIKYNEQCQGNPACKPTENTTDFNNLVHVLAEGQDDTIHYLWSSMGAPGVVLVRTKTKAKLTVDWEKLQNKTAQALSFDDGDILYSVAFVFGRLIEYNDTKDKADLSLAYQNETSIVSLEDLQWLDSNKTLNNSTHRGAFTSTDEKLGTNASLSINFHAFNKTGRSSELPHLQSTANTSQIELILNHLGQHYKQSRFAIELLVLHDENTKQEMMLKPDKSIDDEYTPSVFEIWNLKVPGAIHAGSYSQWKPVTYTNDSKSMSNAVPTKNYGLNATNYFLPDWSIAHAFFRDINSVHKAGLNVSFGLAKDEFVASKYSSWTISIGYGKAPEETISLLIIIIISAGLGIPLVLILFGGIFVGCKKQLNKQTEYESLDNSPARSING